MGTERMNVIVIKHDRDALTHSTFGFTGKVIWDTPNVKCVEYYLDGKKHREDGPAVEWENGDCAYMIHGRYHRKDGPAFYYPNSKFVPGCIKYFYAGEEVSPEDLFEMLTYEEQIQFLFNLDQGRIKSWAREEF